MTTAMAPPMLKSSPCGTGGTAGEVVDRQRRALPNPLDG
jgi:hypothetical protein